MGDVVNLRQARKRGARAVREAEAQANRVSFGLPKPLREIAGIETARREAKLDGAKRDGPAVSGGLDTGGLPPHASAPQNPCKSPTDAPT